VSAGPVPGVDLCTTRIRSLNRFVGLPHPLPMYVAVASAGLAVLDAAMVEPNLLRVRRFRVPVVERYRALAGLRLAHLSDLHVGGRGWREATIARAIDSCNRSNVDLVAITGDFIGSGAGARMAVEMLSTLRSDVPRFAVFGNHDHVYGKRYVTFLSDGLRELGIVVLNNESVPVELRTGRTWVAGVDDGYSMRDNLEAALGSLGPHDYPRILLTHYPEVAEQLRPGQAQLSLAGHSHAGQIRVPILGAMMHNGHARTKYGKGLFTVNGNPLCVSAGVGMSGVPMRFRNPPEVPLISFFEGQRCCSGSLIVTGLSETVVAERPRPVTAQESVFSTEDH
jgi:uncharacterized protein